MIEIDIPGKETLRLEHAVFDVNGTLALDGELLAGVAERMAALGERLTLHMLTADTHGRQAAIDAALGFQATIVSRGSVEKAAYVLSLGGQGVVAIGNGANDTHMLQAAALSIAVLGPEGLAFEAIKSADVVTGSILDALDLLLKPDRLRATLRR
ncbi:MAG: HAD hydrolase family protein [Anaerolineae bacterium]|nr:HAD hydrolase family protein [Anaerolineae bacterium]